MLSPKIELKGGADICISHNENHKSVVEDYEHAPEEAGKDTEKYYDVHYRGACANAM